MTEDKEPVGAIVAVSLIIVFFGGIVGYLVGLTDADEDTRQLLCREFTEKTTDYINCNTKNINEIIVIIKKR